VNHGIDIYKPALLELQDAPYNQLGPTVYMLKTEKPGIDDPDLVPAIK
jgi:hypothetical protein